MPQYRYAAKIPVDLPYVVRYGPVARKVLLACALLPALVLLAIDLVLETQDLTAGGLADAVLIFVLSVLVLLVVGLGYWGLAIRPRLAADEHGVWVYARRWPAKAIWLPWDEVAGVERASSWQNSPAILIQPHDPHAGRGIGALAAIQQGWLSFRYNGRLVAKLPMFMTSSSVLDSLGRLAAAAERARAGQPEPAVPGYAGQPAAGAPAAGTAQPFQRAPRPPDNLPVTLTNSRRQPLALIAPIVVVLALGITIAVTLGASMETRLTAGAVVVVAGIPVCVFALTITRYRGPVLAADGNGVWVRYRTVSPGRNDAIFLPWDTIATINVITGTTLILHVRPKHPWQPAQSQVPTTDDRLLAVAFSSGMVVRVDPGLRPPADLVSSLTALAAGRCRITLNDRRFGR